MKKTRTVNAWAVVGENGIMKLVDGFWISPKRKEVAMLHKCGEIRIVPCTITYQLPDKKK